MRGADPEPLLTIDECLVLIGRTWDEIERAVLEQAAAETIAEGFNADDVWRVIEKRWRLLRESRRARLETAKQMLEARALRLQ